MRLLLVNDSVDSYTSFVEAAAENVETVVYNFYEDTYESILRKILVKVELSTEDKTFESVGFVCHGTSSPFTFKLVETEKAIGEKTEFIDFLSQLSSNTFDLMACSLYSFEEWVQFLNDIEQTTGFDLRASTDDTGNLSSPFPTPLLSEGVSKVISNGDPTPNWILESDNVNVKDLYFTTLIDEYTGLLQLYNNSNTFRVSNALNTSNPKFSTPRAAYVWGLNGDYDMNNYTFINEGTEEFVAIYKTDKAFAGLRADGTVAVWGDVNTGGNPDQIITLNSQVTETNKVDVVFSTSTAFCAVLLNSSTGAKRIFVWGPANGGGSLTAATDLNNYLDSLSLNISQIYSSTVNTTFSALLTDGTVFYWGQNATGGFFVTIPFDPLSTKMTFSRLLDTSAPCGVRSVTNPGQIFTWNSVVLTNGSLSTLNTAISGGLSVLNAYSTSNAYAFLCSDGRVYVAGNSFNGGNSGSGSAGFLTDSVTGVIYVEITKPIYPTDTAFVVIQASPSVNPGKVFCWGTGLSGTMSQVATLNGAITPLKRVLNISSNESAFAATMSDATVYVWGNLTNGGDAGSFGPGFITIPNAFPTSPIVNNSSAFTLKNGPNQVYVWGLNAYGGGVPSTGVPGLLDLFPKQCDQVTGSLEAFAALMTDKTVYVWGNEIAGGAISYNSGDQTYGGPGFITALTNVAKIYSNTTGFTVLMGPGVTVPDAPTNLEATPGDSSVSLAFTPPANDGGATITGYILTILPDNVSQNVGPTSPIEITGLTNGVEYSFKLAAVNSAGSSVDSSSSNNVTPEAPPTPGVPSEPMITEVVLGVNQATVFFKPPTSDGGSPILKYIGTATPVTSKSMKDVQMNQNGTPLGTIPSVVVEGTSSPLVIAPLLNGVTYSFSVLAVNANGDGLPDTYQTPFAPLPNNKFLTPTFFYIVSFLLVCLIVIVYVNQLITPIILIVGLVIALALLIIGLVI